MKPLPVLFAAAAALVASSSHAQWRAASLETLPPPALALGAPADSVPFVSPANRSHRVVVRSAAGAVGVGLGFLAGLALGAGVESSNEEDSGLLSGFIGAAAGGVVGGGVAAALPSYGGRCGFGERLSRGVLGSLAGTFTGLVLVSATDDGGWAVIPVAGGIGAGMAAEC